MTIDPAFLDELDRFDASRKRESDALLHGEVESHAVGEGLTFSDYRRYTPGDDIRLLDWKVLARTDEYFIKQFEEERNLTVHVLVDASASMGFGEGEANKFEVAAKIGLGFCYLTAEEHNDFRFSIFRSSFDRLDGGQSTRGEVLQLIDHLNGTEPGGESAFEETLEDYASTVDTRSMVLVVSDFLSDPAEISAGIGALARNDVVLGHVVAPEERDPDAAGDTIFEEPESGSELRTYFAGARAAGYRERLDAHLDEVAARAHHFRAEHRIVDTGGNFFDAFAELWGG